ncbi:MAG TPA: hypothetical protein DFR83_26490, partial [Deltaproteobacteria bacterium]|nr:hypothetical protein [Deltaproteobacteria bacterium]
MKKRELDAIQKFVSNTGATDLFAYFEVARDADIETVEAAVRRKRAWAQGQQANPKYRQTAIWVIKNVGLCKRALGSERGAYVGEITKAAQSGALEVLGNVLDGAVYDHKLSAEREEAVLDRGVQLGLPDTVVERYIEDYLDRHDARRASPPEFVDLYEVLGVDPDASSAEIQQAVARGLDQAQGLNA